MADVPVLAIEPPALVDFLAATFADWGHLSPVADAVLCVEALAEQIGIDLPEVTGMPWASYRTYRAGIVTAVRIARACLRRHPRRDELVVALQTAVIACAGDLDAGIARWSAEQLSLCVDAVTAAEITGDVVVAARQAVDDVTRFD